LYEDVNKIRKTIVRGGRKVDQNIEKPKTKQHPQTLQWSNLLFAVIISSVGAIVGLELVTRVGITPNTSIVGALIAILVAQIPMKLFRNYKDINSQNLMQTSISGATFSAANGLILPMGIPYLMGRPDLVFPVFIGAALAVLVDVSILYFSFDSAAFPVKAAWPPGIATAEAILAAAEKGKRAVVLLYGIAGGAVGKYFGIPTDLLGIAWIGNIFALLAFSVGLLVRGYGMQLFGVDINKMYIPHGVMIGAGLVALIQIVMIIYKQHSRTETAGEYSTTTNQLKMALGRGFGAYIIVALLLALISGLMTEMSFGMLVAWVLFAAVAAIVSELIVGIAAMHSGWFPAFATALIFLVLGMLIGFPPLALAILVGYTAATGPAFADMAYDLKAGWILRGRGSDVEFELEGRKQQYLAEIVGIVVAIVLVALVYPLYFSQNLIPPVDKVYVATIKAGTSSAVATSLLIWAIPGAIIQFLGGPSKQLGVLFATGLLINFPVAGITVLVALAVRYVVVRVWKEEGQNYLYILGAGAITGAALQSFFASTMKLGKK
jgi:uncharacterized oligopeptide transporter (OPT) family protein